MQALLFNFSNIALNLLGDSKYQFEDDWMNKVLTPILNLLDTILLPLLIIIGTAGSIYAVILGVNFSRAETADKREEAKKRMINAIIGIVAMIFLLIVLQLFVTNAEVIVTWITGYGKTETPTTP